jgi:hypothetical protein
MIVNPDTMSRLTVFSFAILISVTVCAQTVKVGNKANRVKANTCAGYATELDGKITRVEDDLVKFLKEYGKPRSTTDYIAVLSPILGGQSFDGKTLYAMVTGDDNKSQVWIGIDTAEWKDASAPTLERIEKLTYQFGIWYYKNQVQKEIDDSQRAFDATEKQKVRLTNQAKDLTLRLGDNQQERTQLEKRLELNSLEKAVLQQKIENNKKAQDSVANAGVQIKKVLETQKEKQNRIN